MNRLILKCLAALTLLVAGVAELHAVPARGGSFTHQQPDGTVLMLRLVGDEYMHYYQNEVDGSKMSLGEDGHYYPISDVQFDNVLAEANARRSASQQRRMQRLSAPLRAMGQPNRVGSFGNMTGSKKGLVILVNFADKAMTTGTQAKFNNMFNQEGYNSDGHIGSVADFFKDQSYGKFNLSFDVVGPVTLSQNMAYYGGNDANGSDLRPAQMVKEACSAVDDQVNFADYDWTGDGFVDQVFIIYAGYGENYQGADANTIWPHEWDLVSAGLGVLTLDGKKIKTYACCAELYGTKGTNLNGMGTACHEFSHCLGYPDSYDIDYSGGIGMDSYDVMCGGSYNGPNGRGEVPSGYTAYQRWMAGWLTPTELDEAATITDMSDLGTSASAYIVYNPSNNNEYFLLENRQSQKWFSCYDYNTAGHGLFITYIDYSSSVWSQNKPNDNPVHQRMTWVPADGNYGDYDSTKKTWSVTSSQQKGDYFPGTGNVTSFTNSSHTDVYGKWFNGTSNDFKSITDITESDGKISFLFDGGDAGTRYTVTFNAGAGSCTTSSWTQTTSSSESVTLPEATIESDDWTFVGWCTANVAQTTTKPTVLKVGDSYKPTADVTLYAVYTKTEASSGSGTYTLDYSVETALADSKEWGSYAKAYSYTATDGGTWVVKAYKNKGMQINSGKDASIKVPECSSPISSIEITASIAKVFKFSNTDYTGANNPTAAATSASSTSATLDLSGKGLTTGYIYTTDGSTSITKIVVTYGSGSTTYYATSPSLTTLPTPIIAFANVGDKEMLVGDTYTNEASASCTGVTLPPVTYSSSKTDVATVDASSGQVTAVGVGTTTITARVEAVDGKSKAAWTTYTITVAMPTLSSIAITTPPTKTDYTEGEDFNPAGMVVMATYANGYTCEVIGYTCDPTTIGQSDTQVTISYTEGDVTQTATVAITVTALPRYTVTFHAGAGTCGTASLTESDYQGGVTLPACSDASSVWKFAGWAEESVATATETKPTLLQAGDTYKPTADCTLYAVFAKTEGEDEVWKKVAASAVNEGGTYALITTDGHAFNGTIDGNGHGLSTASMFSFDSNDEATSAPEGTCMLTFERSGSGYTIYNVDKGYLYAKKAESGNLAWHSTESSYWSYSDYNWTYNLCTAYLRSYNGTFRTYGRSTNSVVAFAKLTGGATVTYYSTPNISVLKSIAITTSPIKTEYQEGEEFNPEGMIVTATYEDGTSRAVSRYSYSPSTLGIEDTQVIVSYTEDGVTMTANVDVIVTALPKYTITFEAGHGTCAIGSFTEETYHGGVTLPTCTPESDDYVFVGWSTTESGIEVDAGVENAIYYPSGDCTLYAVYRKVYTITWIVNGNITTSAVVEGEDIEFNNPERTVINGKNFMGWSESPIDGTTDEAPTYQTVATANQDKTYYAVFATIETTDPKDAVLSTSFTSPSDGWIVNQSGGTSYWKIFGGNSITSPSFDLSTLKSVVIQMGTFGNGTHSLDIKANGETLWENYAPKSSSESTSYAITSETSLSGNGTLVFTSTNESTSAGLRIKSIKIHYQEGETIYSGYCTTVEAQKTLQGITLSGTPSEFWVGDVFNHDGMTVTAIWSDGDPTDVTADAVFSAPDMTTAGQKSVIVTYKDKTASYDITVNSVETYEISLVQPEGATITATPSTAAAGTEITLSYSGASEHYRFVNWSVMNGETPIPVTDNKFTMPAANVTVSATFEEDAKHYAVFSVNGTITKEAAYYEGDAIEFPTKVDALGEMVFCGWYGETYSHATEAPDYVTSAVMGTQDVTYYAVFATPSGNGSLEYSLDESKIKTNFTKTTRAYTDSEISFEDGDVTWGYVGYVQSAGAKFLQIRNKNSASYVAIEAKSNISKVSFSIKNGTDADFSGNVYLKTNFTDISTAEDDGIVGSCQVSGQSGEISTSGTYKKLYLQVDAPCHLYGITVTCVDVSYSGYTTSVPEQVIATYEAKFFAEGIQVGETQTLKNGDDVVFPDDPTPSNEDYTFIGWSTSEILTPQDAEPTLVSSATMGTEALNFYAVYAQDVVGAATWNEVKAAPADGTYAIVSDDYFMKAEIANSRFTNGDAKPSFLESTLETAPSEDCTWEIYKASDGYYRIKNGTKFAGATGSKNQGALLTSESVDQAKWSISYVSNQFEIINYGRSIATSDPNNKYLRNNATSGWATYQSVTGKAPRLFKKTEVTVTSGYTTTLPGNERETPTIAMEDISLAWGETLALVATTTPMDLEVTYSIKSGSENVAISAGVLKGIGVGSAVITATTTATAQYKSASIDVNVDVIVPVGIAAIRRQISSTLSGSPDPIMAKISDAVVTYVSSSATPTIYVEDENAGIAIYMKNTGLNPGDVITGTITGAGYVYNGLTEISQLDLSSASITSGGEIPCTDVTIADLTANISGWASRRVRLSQVTVSAAIDNRNATVAQGDNSITVRESIGGCTSDLFGTEGASIAYIVGYPQAYNSTPQLSIWSADDVFGAYNRSVTAGNWGTICLPRAVDLELSEDVKFYNIAGTSLKNGKIDGIVLVEEIEDLEAGKPYLFKATSSELKLYCFGVAAELPADATGLVGNFSGNLPVPAGCYVLSSNKIRMVLEGAEAYAGPNRAYIDLTEVGEYDGSAANALRFGFDGEVEDFTTYIQTVQYDAEVEIFDLLGNKVQTMKKGQLYIVNGKKMFNK